MLSSEPTGLVDFFGSVIKYMVTAPGFRAAATMWLPVTLGLASAALVAWTPIKWIAKGTKDAVRDLLSLVLLNAATWGSVWLSGVSESFRYWTGFLFYLLVLPISIGLVIKAFSALAGRLLGHSGERHDMPDAAHGGSG